jgi:hypothetical protein
VDREKNVFSVRIDGLRKWTMSNFTYVLDCILINATAIFKSSMRIRMLEGRGTRAVNNGLKGMAHDIVVELKDELDAKLREEAAARATTTPPTAKRTIRNIAHRLTPTVDTTGKVARMQCVVCTKEGLGPKRRTTRRCAECLVPLCDLRVRDCFDKYHADKAQYPWKCKRTRLAPVLEAMSAAAASETNTG